MTSQVMDRRLGEVHGEAMSTTEASLPTPTLGAAGRAAALRTTLRVNAATSLAGGLVAALAPDRLDEILGTGHPGWVRLVGIGLAIFALDVGLLSWGTPRQLRRWTPQVVSADVTWVVASACTIALGWYDVAGAAAIAAVAVAVSCFAYFQRRFVRQL